MNNRMTMLVISVILAFCCSPLQADSAFRVLGAAFSPFNENCAVVVFNREIKQEEIGSTLDFFFDMSIRQKQAEVASDYPYLIKVEFPQSVKPLPDSMHFINIGIRKSGDSLRYESFVQSPPFIYRTIEAEANKILTTQLPSGGIPLHLSVHPPFTGEKITMIPYFSHIAAQGLIIAYQHKQNPEYLKAVRQWLDWYSNQMNPDGTVNDYRGVYPALENSGDMDSTDSYAAFYLCTLRDYLILASNDKFLKESEKNLARAIAAMELTLQDDHLTFAKPSYRIKYLMDNIEVIEGYKAAVDIANLLQDCTLARQYTQKAEQTKQAINEKFFSSEKQVYAFAVDEEGTPHFDQKYYPGLMAQCFALTYRVNPSRDPEKAVWSQVRNEIFQSPENSATSIDAFTIYAADAMNSPSHCLAAWAMMQPNIPAMPFTFSCGHIIRILDTLKPGSAAPSLSSQ